MWDGRRERGKVGSIDVKDLFRTCGGDATPVPVCAFVVKDAYDKDERETTMQKIIGFDYKKRKYSDPYRVQGCNLLGTPVTLRVSKISEAKDFISQHKESCENAIIEKVPVVQEAIPKTRGFKAQRAQAKRVRD